MSSPLPSLYRLADPKTDTLDGAELRWVKRAAINYEAAGRELWKAFHPKASAKTKAVYNEVAILAVDAAIEVTDE